MEYDLERFKKAQAPDYETALREIRSGRKRSHWMWYIFPQLRGLGRSQMSDYYGLADADEAGAYLADPVLGPRLEEISAALLDLEGRSAREIFGYPDCMKLWSCMTLFEAVSGDDSVFRRVLDMYYGGERDQGTMQLMDKG